jgi:hypothetical protein
VPRPAGEQSVPSGTSFAALEHAAAQPLGEESLLNTAMDAFGRQVRRLIDEPNAFPFQLDLPKILGLIDQFCHAAIGIARVGVDKAAAIADAQQSYRYEE